MKTDTKTRILQAGSRIVHLKGYLGAGIQEITRTAGIPKGSFYFHFQSKEDFGLALIGHYGRAIDERMDRFLAAAEGTPLAGIRQFFAVLAASFAKNDFRGGCPIGNLSLEMGDLNDTFRARLAEILEGMKLRIEGCLKEEQENGVLPVGLDTAATADFIINSWEGALLRMRVTRDTKPWEMFDRIIFKEMLMMQD